MASIAASDSVSLSFVVVASVRRCSRDSISKCTFCSMSVRHVRSLPSTTVGCIRDGLSGSPAAVAAAGAGDAAFELGASGAGVAGAG